MGQWNHLEPNTTAGTMKKQLWLITIGGKHGVEKCPSPQLTIQSLCRRSLAKTVCPHITQRLQTHEVGRTSPLKLGVNTHNQCVWMWGGDSSPLWLGEAHKSLTADANPVQCAAGTHTCIHSFIHSFNQLHGGVHPSEERLFIDTAGVRSSLLH